MARGAKWRARREWERLAWVVSNIIAPHVKRPPTVKRLTAFLGPDEDAAELRKQKGGGPKDTSPEGVQAFLDGLARVHKKHAWMILGDKWAPTEKTTDGAEGQGK